MTLALDANVIIDLMRGHEPVRRSHTLARQGGATLGVSVLVVEELRFGAELSARSAVEHQLVDGWLASMEIAPFELEDAHVAARTQAVIERRGRRAPFGDFLIGAHALARGQALVTANTIHFQNIPGLRLLDWRRGPNPIQDENDA